MASESVILAPEEAKVILAFLDRVATQGLQDAANLVALARKLDMIAHPPQRHPEEPDDPDVVEPS